jgi:hypothetical protein
MTITLRELGRRLRAVSAMPLTSAEIMKLVDAAGLGTDLEGEIGAADAQRLLDQASLRVSVTGADIVAQHWAPPPAETGQTRPAAPPMVFSNPGAVDDPVDPPERPRRQGQSQGQRNNGRGRSQR